MLVSGGYCLIFVWSAEILNTKLRNFGLGIVMFIGRMLISFVPYL